jgi:hypothetical protein
MVQLSATRCSCIAILWVSLVSFAVITLCVASQRVFIFISVSMYSGIFWIHPRTTNAPYNLCNATDDDSEQHTPFIYFVATNRLFQSTGKFSIHVNGYTPLVWSKWNATTSCLLFNGKLPSLYWTLHWLFLSSSSALDRVYEIKNLTSEKNCTLPPIFWDHFHCKGGCRI